jgi:hypothetical protein
MSVESGWGSFPGAAFFRLRLPRSLTVYPLFVISTSVLLPLAKISELVIIEVFANHGVLLLCAVISELRQPKSREKSTILVQIFTQHSVNER